MAAEIAGLAGTPSPQVLSVQGVAGGTPIPVGTTPLPSTSTVVTKVPGAIVNTTLLAANAARLGATLYNSGNKAWFVKLGATSTLTSYTVAIQRDAYYEVPYGYTGIITGLQAVANGDIYVTELT